MNRKVFCTYCSADKRTTPGEIEAVERYKSGRIASLFAAAGAINVPLFILSGKFGLISHAEPIPWYDHLLLPTEVDELSERVQSQIRSHGITGLVYFTVSLAEDTRLVPYHDVMSAACKSTGTQFVIVNIATDAPWLERTTARQRALSEDYERPGVPVAPEAE